MGRRMRTGLVVVAAGIPAIAASWVAGPAQAAGFGAHWVFNEVGSPPSVLHDVSGNGNDGRPVGAIVGDGSGFTFNPTGTSGDSGTGRVAVPDSATLNPGTADFSYAVTVVTAVPTTGTDYDLLRKGYASTSGGEFKVEILRTSTGGAKAFCLVKDTSGHTGRVSSKGVSLADGQPHTITCTKTSTHVTVTVDNLSPRAGSSVTGGLGDVSNGAPLTIAAKADSGGDWFHGRMTDAALTAESAPAPPPPPPSGGSGAHWSFDETGTPPAELVDDSGNGNNGHPQGGIVGDGAAYTFDGSTGLVTVPDSASLDPGTADFSTTVKVTTGLPATGRYEVLRKGVGSTRGGEYGLEVVNANGAARAVCLVKDGAGHSASIRSGGGTLADGQEHTITCAKTSTSLTVTVDGGSARTKTASGGLGSVDNAAPLVFGAIGASGGSWFAGSIGDATVK